MVDLHYDTHKFKNLKEASQINLEAIEWAVKNCPSQYSSVMIDNKFILRKLFGYRD